MRLAGVAAVLARGAVLLARHWPALVVIWLLGWLGREGAVRLAVSASEVHAAAGVLALALAILAELVALVWMLRVLRSSAPLPEPAAAASLDGTDDAASATRWRRFVRRAVPSLDSTASVLVPFLAIYVAQDSFRLLFLDYAERVVADQSNDILAAGLGGQPIVTQERLPWGGLLVWTVAGVAFGVRWLLRRTSRRQSSSGWSLLRSTVAAYVEVVWLVLLVAALNARRREVIAWIDQRRVVRAAGDVAGSIADSLGFLSRPLHAARQLVVDSLGALDKVLLLPIAMLTVAAVVYGTTVAKPPPRDLTAAPLQRVGGRWVRVPRRVRWVAEAQVASIGKRFQPMIDGIRLLTHAGLGPMLLFCVAFGAQQMVDEWMSYVWRWAIGPQPFETWLAASPVLVLAEQLVVGVLSAALIGAAVERITSDERARLAAEAASSPAPETAPPAGATPAVTAG